MEALGLKPIHETLAKLGLPKDPPLQEDVPPLNVAEIAGTAQRLLGLDLFLNFYVSEDVRDTSKYRIVASNFCN